MQEYKIILVSHLYFLSSCFSFLIKAWKLYHQGAEKNLFLSAAQRSTENAESKLRAQPWWRVEETGYEKEIRLE